MWRGCCAAALTLSSEQVTSFGEGVGKLWTPVNPRMDLWQTSDKQIFHSGNFQKLLSLISVAGEYGDLESFVQLSLRRGIIGYVLEPLPTASVCIFELAAKQDITRVTLHLPQLCNHFSSRACELLTAFGNGVYCFVFPFRCSGKHLGCSKAHLKWFAFADLYQASYLAKDG